jgi:Uma2 family endonuclease
MTLRRDRRVKHALYASAGIPEFWIVNLEAKEVEVYRLPAADAYSVVDRKRPGDVATIEALPGVAIAISQILG